MQRKAVEAAAIARRNVKTAAALAIVLTLAGLLGAVA